MAKIQLDPISSGFRSIVELNDNFQKIEDELNNKVLYRNNATGEANYLQQDLDVNGKNLLNVGGILKDGEEYLTQLQTIYNNFLLLTSKITVSQDPPSGGQDGDIWFQHI